MLLISIDFVQKKQILFLLALFLKGLFDFECKSIKSFAYILTFAALKIKRLPN